MNTTSAWNAYCFPAIGAATAAAVNSVLSLPLNGYVAWLILARQTLASDFFSLNLSVSDIFFAVSSIWIFVFLPLGSMYLFEGFMFARGLFLTARPLFQCFICLEYYVGVIHPVLFLQLKPLKYRVACCCAVWLIVLVSCIYIWYTYTNPLYLYGYVLQNVLLLSIMIFCCLSVLRALKRPGPGENNTEKKKSNKMKRRACKILLLSTIFMAINFFLYIVAIPLLCCLETGEFIHALNISSSLALTTGFIQPLLYLYRTGNLLCFKKF